MNALDRIAEIMSEIDFTDYDKLDAIQEILDEEGY